MDIDLSNELSKLSQDIEPWLEFDGHVPKCHPRECKEHISQLVKMFEQRHGVSIEYQLSYGTNSRYPSLWAIRNVSTWQTSKEPHA